jgi:hypothetical protein
MGNQMSLCVNTTTPTLVLASGVEIGLVFLIAAAVIVARRMVVRAIERATIIERRLGNAK